MTTVDYSLLKYTTVKKVVEMFNLYQEAYGESIGTGDNSNKTFYVGLAKGTYRVVQGTLSVYISGALKTETTDYSVDYDTGTVTFVNAPANLAPVTADYWRSDLTSSSLFNFIRRAENEIESEIGRYFGPYLTTTEFVDGFGSDRTEPYLYNQTSYDTQYQMYKTTSIEYFQDKTVFMLKYPIQNVYLLAKNVQSTAGTEETAYDSDQSFGKTTYVAIKLSALGANPIVAVKTLLKYSAGTAAAITCSLYADSGGVPTGSALATAVAQPALTDTNYAFYTFVFNQPYSTVSGTTYHLVFSSASASAITVYSMAYDTVASGGTLSTSVNSGTAWTASSTKSPIYYVLTGEIVADENYRVYYDQGRVVTTKDSGVLLERGLQNVLISYSYGYSSVPQIVEELATKITAVTAIESRLMGSPVPMSVPKENIDAIKKDILALKSYLGRRLEVYRI